MAKKQTNKNTEDVLNTLYNQRLKYFIEMINFKSDTNMTRVYSVIKKSNFINSIKNV